LNRPKTTGFNFFTLYCRIYCCATIPTCKEDEQQEMSNILKIVNQNLEQSLKNCYTTINLALTINDKGFLKILMMLVKALETNNVISAVQLVPQGIIRYIYPLK
jgi:hypothetical protein